MAGFNLWDLGACNCGLACVPCTLPAQDLTVTLVVASGAGTGTYSGTLVYSTTTVGGVTVNLWRACLAANINAAGNGSIQFELGCAPGSCSYATAIDRVGLACAGAAGLTWDYHSGTGCGTLDPAFAAGAANNNLTLTSSTCSPLSITWTAGRLAFTVTL